jgi:hypothetical protein
MLRPALPRTDRGRPGGRRHAGWHEAGGEADYEPRPDLPPPRPQMPLWVVFGTNQPPSAPRWVRRVSLMSRRTAGRTHCDPEETRSGRQPETTLGPTSLQNGATGAGGHPVTEPVLLRALAIIWLKSSFHPVPPRRRCGDEPAPFGLAAPAQQVDYPGTRRKTSPRETEKG